MSQRQKQIAKRAPLRRWLRFARVPRRTVDELMTAMFPEATENERDFYLWDQTGFPCFWTKPDGVRCLVEQLLVVRAAIDNHRALEYRLPITAELPAATPDQA